MNGPSWRRLKLKYLVALKSGDAIDGKDIKDEGDYPVYGGNGLRGYTGGFTHEGDRILIGRQGALCGNINYASGKFWATEHAIVATPRQDFNTTWLGEALRALNLNQYAQSAAQPGIAVEVIENLEVMVPPPPEQDRIARRLWASLSNLNRLVVAKRALLDLLTEKRRTLMAHVVARGLDPEAPMRDSGVDWLGKIPAHWQVSRIAWLFEERDERGRPDLPLLEVSIHGGVRLREFSDDRIEQTAADPNSYKVAEQGDICFNKMRMWQGAVGAVPQHGLVSPDYVVARPTAALDSEYFGRLFQTPACSAEAGRRSHGIVWDRLRLYWEEFRDMAVPVPPLVEQREIVEEANRAAAEIDALRRATETTVSLLEERRTSLIAEAICGAPHCAG